VIKGLMRRTAEDVIEIDGRSALHGLEGIRRALPLGTPGALDRTL
jgi:hypothetical protein